MLTTSCNCSDYSANELRKGSHTKFRCRPELRIGTVPTGIFFANGNSSTPILVRQPQLSTGPDGKSIMIILCALKPRKGKARSGGPRHSMKNHDLEPA